MTRLFSLATCAVMGSLLFRSPAGAEDVANTCVKSFADKGTSFDLAPLKTSNYYKVRNEDAGSENYTYVFNVCGNTAEVPGSGPSGRGDACVNTTNWGGNDHMWGPSPAYQISHTHDLCWRMADDYEKTEVEWSLLEPEDPSRGVVMKYEGGNLCGNEDKRRMMEIAFPCADDILNIPDQEVIEELATCTYQIVVPSIYGCPTECGVKDRQLCNNKGICRFDRFNKKSRCFCSEGWKGDACDEAMSSSEGSHTTLEVLIFVCVFLAIVIAGISVVWIKIRGLRLDPEAYATLSGGSRQQQEEL